MKSVANRKFHMPTCKTCNSTITEFFYYRADRTTMQSCQGMTIVDHKPDLDKDTGRYYQSYFNKQQGDEKGKKFILSLSFPLPKQKDYETKSTVTTWKCASLTVCLDLDFGPESAEDETKLRQIFSALHVPLFNDHKAKYKDETLPQFTPSEYMEYAAFEDESLLLKLLYSFATGRMQLDAKQFKLSNGYRSQFMAVAVAKDMLQNISLGTPAPFQLMLSQQLQHYGAKSELVAYLSSIRVSASISHSRNLALAAQKQSNTLRVATDVLDIASAHFDNIGFKGRKNLWSQHCLMQVKSISKTRLKNDGFYKGTLDRKRLTFRELANTVDFHMEDVEDCSEGTEEFEAMDKLVSKVVDVRKEDKVLLSQRIMKSIDCVINLHLPTFDECAQMDKLNEISWKTSIPLNLGNEIVDPILLKKGEGETESKVKIEENTKSSGMMTNGKSQKLLFEGSPTIYEANNMVLDSPLHEDPNATKTVIQLMDYLERASSWNPDQVDFEETNGEPPVRDLLAPATCDGSPMKRFLDIIDEDRRNHRDKGTDLKYPRVRFFLGGMHYLMEVANMSNRLSRDFLSFFVSDWRPTEPRLNWLLCVSDPTDYVLEMPQFIVGHYRAAADGLQKKRDDENDDRPITAADVHEHMLERALEYPVCMAVLLTLRFIEIAFMVRDSEKSGEHGDVDLFLATMRLSLPIFAASHATYYMHICCDFLEWWEMASEAEKVFFRKYLFTQKSPLGKPVWADRAVEWTMRHVRMFLGRYARPNQNQRIDRVVAEIPFRMAARRDLRAITWRENNLDMYSSVAFNLQSVKLSKVYIKTYLKARRTNLWGAGGLDGELFGENDDEDDSETRFGFPIAGEDDLQPMSSSYLPAYETGENRVRDYYKKWHIQNRHPEKRQGLNRTLKLIPSQSSVRQADIKKMKVVKLSTDPAELKDLKNEYPKKDIIRDLDHLRETHYPQIPLVSDRNKRESLLGHLCTWRERYFREFPRVFEQHLERAEAVEWNDNRTDYDTRSEELKHFIYSLEEDTVNRFCA